MIVTNHCEMRGCGIAFDVDPTDPGAPIACERCWALFDQPTKDHARHVRALVSEAARTSGPWQTVDEVIAKIVASTRELLGTRLGDVVPCVDCKHARPAFAWVIDAPGMWRCAECYHAHMLAAVAPRGKR